MFTQPAVWQEPNQGAVWVYVANDCTLTGYQVVTDQQGNTLLSKAWELPITTSSPLVAGGVLFAATNGALLGLDPLTGQQLWSSAKPGAAGPLGAIHWESPIVVGSKVYVPDETGALLAFGLG